MIREGRELIPTAKAFQLMTLLRGLGVEELSATGADRRVGVQARADGARQARARRVHARNRRDDEAHRHEGEGVRPRHRPGRLRDAGDAVPELRRRGQGELPALHLQRQAGRQPTAAASRSARRPPAAPSSWPRSSSCCARRRSVRSTGSVRRPVGRSRPRSSSSTTTTKKNWKLEFDFGDDGREETGEPVDFTGQEPLGICPKSGGRVFESGQQLRLRACGARPPSRPTPTCDFKSRKIILQQPVAREQMTKLLATGKTDLLDGFVSMRTRRPFKAFLAWDKEAGKVSFEFAPSKFPGRKKPFTRRRPAGAAGCGTRVDRQRRKMPARKKPRAASAPPRRAQGPRKLGPGLTPSRGAGGGHRRRAGRADRGDQEALGLHQGQRRCRTPPTSAPINADDAAAAGVRQAAGDNVRDCRDRRQALELIRRRWHQPPPRRPCWQYDPACSDWF